MSQPQPQAQHQYQMSTPQSATSPGVPQDFTLPPHKRQRLSPNPTSQPNSPYVQSPYTNNSPVAAAPTSAGVSPHFANVQIPSGVYNTPYSNGNTNSSINISHSLHNPLTSPLSLPIPTPNYQAGQNNLLLTPHANGTQQTNGLTTNGIMGPPSKPYDKSKEDGTDVMDVLGGTGIDLREEEQYTYQMYNSFNSTNSNRMPGSASTHHSFSQLPPGDSGSFYGAGPANAAGAIVDTESQDQYHQKLADEVWNDAARSLAISRQVELNRPFLDVAILHGKAARVAQENGVSLNTDSKGTMGTMMLPNMFPRPSVNVQTAVGPNGTITGTGGVWLPSESLLVEQLALISIAAKFRLRGLIEHAALLAKQRRTDSHGVIPEEWADVAVPINLDLASMVEAVRPNGRESAISPFSKSTKLSAPSASILPTPGSDGTKTPNTTLKFGNEVVTSMRSEAVRERESEEIRLRKRLDRTARASGDTASRQSSAIPGTPGSVAPESTEKAPTKREAKKKAEAKVNEAASHAAANVTTAQFLGGGGGIFGKKKKYSWMTGGGTASAGPGTPGKIVTQGLPGAPGGAPPAVERLTAEGARRLGTWREDHEKGIGIQLRDWTYVLEDDGKEKRALQRAYVLLDSSEPK